MGVNVKKDSECMECGKTYSNTKEMYNLMVCNTKFTLCFDCVELLFKKTLSANVKYNHKVKSQEDMKRVRRDSEIKNIYSVQKVELPSCYGEFKKHTGCKKCKYNKECKDVFYSFTE